jgi:rfaE bifunctional protein kinase chain/domain
VKKSVLVIGDLILDVHRCGTSTRTSPEDPRCRVLNLSMTSYELGGAANVARWLAAPCDIDVHYMCLLGSDTEGRKTHELFVRAGIRVLPMFCSETTVKERICVTNDDTIEQMVRVDRDSTAQMIKSNLEFARRMIDDMEPDAIVVADYGKGVFDGMTGEILRQDLSGIKPLTVVNAKDPGRWSHLWLDYLICNDKEALKTWGTLTDHEIVQKCLADNFVRTRGEMGVTMCNRGGRHLSQPTQVEGLVDVTGAGDAFTAGFAHAMLATGDQETALAEGSRWAAHCCKHIGCGSPYKPNVRG